MEIFLSQRVQEPKLVTLRRIFVPVLKEEYLPLLIGSKMFQEELTEQEQAMAIREFIFKS